MRKRLLSMVLVMGNGSDGIVRLRATVRREIRLRKLPERAVRKLTAARRLIWISGIPVERQL